MLRWPETTLRSAVGRRRSHSVRETLYGRQAVRECLRAGRRQAFRLLVAEGGGKADPTGTLAEIVRTAERRRIPVQSVPRDAFDKVTRTGNPQGVALEAAEYPYAELDDILALAQTRGEPPFVLLLDLLQDPQNAGALLRAAEAAGVHGAVLQDRRSVEITPAVVNASAGAVEHLLVARETNLVRAMEHLQARGLWLAGLDASGETRLDQANLSGPLGLVVGSEGEGLRRLVREKCDLRVRLPMRGNVASLNAATAGSIAIFEAWKARGFEGAVEADAEGTKGNKGTKGNYSTRE